MCCGGTEKKKGHLDCPVPSNSAGASEIFQVHLVLILSEKFVEVLLFLCSIPSKYWNKLKKISQY